MRPSCYQPTPPWAVAIVVFGGLSILASQTRGAEYTATENRIAHCDPVIENCVIVDNSVSGLQGGEPVIINSIIQD